MPKITPLSVKKFCKVFEKAGFIHVRTEGDHIICTKPDVRRPIVIPMLKDIPVFIIKNCLRTAGISREEYFSYLEEI